MTFTVLVLVVEQFLTCLLNLQTNLASKGDIVTPFSYKFIQVTEWKKLTY